jgi:hypothetical protein
MLKAGLFSLHVYAHGTLISNDRASHATGTFLTLTLSADGKEPSYVVGGIRTTYHRVSDQ